jgi:hypothetical protein
VKVDFSKVVKGEYVWEKWIRNAVLGVDGLLVLDGLEPGDIVATVKKDVSSKKTKVECIRCTAKN